MNIEKDSLIARSAVLNKDIQLGIVATQVATWASFIKQAEVKLDKCTMSQEEFDSTISEAADYIQSAYNYCRENALDWKVCVLMANHDLSPYIAN